MYVVEAIESLRDGTERWCQIVSDKNGAESLMKEVVNGFSGRNYSFRLFELGKEIQLDYVEEIETEKVEKKTRKVLVKE